MNNTTYLIVLLLPEDMGQEIDTVRLRLNPISFARAHAHLTLVPPFMTSETEYGLESLVRRTFNHQQYAYFPLQLWHDGLDRDFPSQRHLILKVMPVEELARVRDGLILGLRRAVIEMPPIRPRFYPHITVSSAKSRESWLSQAKVIQQELPPRTFSSSGIVLWRLEETGSPHYETVQVFTV